MDLISVILMIGFLIAFHELGHFLMAYLAGIPIERFSIGFGPILISKRIKGVDIWLSMIPIGGYVLPKFKDLEDLYAVPVRKRVIFSAGGPAFNFILAFWILSFINVYYTGFSISSLLIYPLVQLITMTAGMVVSYSLLIKNPAMISGLIGMTSQGGEYVSGSFIRLLTLTSFLSINLGVFNLLPIPALDGGKILFALLEKVSIRTRRVQVPVTVASVFLLLGLLFFSTIMDVIRLF
jgi:regulator of sigma E protease